MDSKETKVQSERKVTKVYLESMDSMELVVIVVLQDKLEIQVLMDVTDRREHVESDDKVSRESGDQQDPTDQLDLEDPLDFKDKKVNRSQSV